MDKSVLMVCVVFQIKICSTAQVLDKFASRIVDSE